MAERKDKPAILLGIVPELSEDAVRWVAYGAEEEGVPCRVDSELTGAGATELGYRAAGQSRFKIGIGIDRSEIVLHEAHMPEGKPVLRLPLRDETLRETCRMFGHNAARMVTQRPLILEPEKREAEKPEPEARAETEPEDIKRAVSAVLQRLRERGVL